VWSIAVGDFNNDGKLDIAATILTNGTQVTLALGNGDGTFQQPVLLPVACIDCYLTAADFNLDGNMDLAVVSTSSVTVYLGQGNGKFTGGQPSYPTNFSVALTSGDLNQDGKADLVVTNSAGALVLFGNGNGSFQGGVRYAVAKTPFQTVIADLNGDGLPDMATVARDSDTVAVFLNLGGAPTARLSRTRRVARLSKAARLRACWPAISTTMARWTWPPPAPSCTATATARFKRPSMSTPAIFRWPLPAAI